jgi:hypothetical protein
MKEKSPPDLHSGALDLKRSAQRIGRKRVPEILRPLTP